MRYQTVIFAVIFPPNIEFSRHHWTLLFYTYIPWLCFVYWWYNFHFYFTTLYFMCTRFVYYTFLWLLTYNSIHKQFNKPEVKLHHSMLKNLKDNLTTLLILSLWTISKQTTFYIQSYFLHLDNFKTSHGIILGRFLCSMSGDVAIHQKCTWYKYL